MVIKKYSIDTKIIHFVLFENFNLLDFSGPFQVLSSANKFLCETYYDLSVISKCGGPIASDSNIQISTTPLKEVNEFPDTLIICGGPGVMQACKDIELINWIKHQGIKARRIVSICSGAMILAKCGFLDGRRATTHWSVSERLSSLHPTVLVDDNSIYINDGNIWTSAGVTAGIDLCLSLVEQDTEHKISLKVARDLVLFLRRQGGQNQFSELLFMLNLDKRIDNIYEWISANLSSTITLSELADISMMSERSLSRLCHEIAGMSPLKMVTKIRLEFARSYLDSSDMPIKVIASSCGFKNEINFRRTFLKAYNTTPSLYRDRFR